MELLDVIVLESFNERVGLGDDRLIDEAFDGGANKYFSDEFERVQRYRGAQWDCDYLSIGGCATREWPSSLTGGWFVRRMPAGFRDMDPSSGHTLAGLLRNLSAKLAQEANFIISGGPVHLSKYLTLTHDPRPATPHVFQMFVVCHTYKYLSLLQVRFPILTLTFLGQGYRRRCTRHARDAASSHQSPGISSLPPSIRPIPGDRFPPHQRDGPRQRDPRVLPPPSYAHLSPKSVVTSQLRARNQGMRVFRTVRTGAAPRQSVPG